MPYAVELSDGASAVLERLPVDVVVCVSTELEKLATDPIGLGRKAAFPYRPVGQIYEFWCDAGATNYFVTVFFHFKPGKDVLNVFAIGYREYPT